MEIKRVLFPTDFSDAANRGLTHALTLTQKHGAELTILHVAVPYRNDPNRPEHQYLDGGGYMKYVEEFVEASLNELSQRIESSQVTTVVGRDLSPGSGILDYIRTNRIDLTVMGTHGRTALGHLLLGSVAEKIVRHAPCSVLTVAPDRHGYLDNPDYGNILVAFDFSEHSKEAARKAKELASKFGARLRALYVIERDVPPPYYDIWRRAVTRELSRITGEVREAVRATLGEDLEEADVQVAIGDRKAHTEISEFARENQVDLIVMGTHGRSGLDRFLLGSTAERVVRTAACPVLTCKLSR